MFLKLKEKCLVNVGSAVLNAEIHDHFMTAVRSNECQITNRLTKFDLHCINFTKLNSLL